MSLSQRTRERWERRLDAWAAWFVIETKGGKIKVSGIYASIGAGSYGDAGDCAPNAEILETHGFVCKLPVKQHKALIAWFTWTGSPGSKASELGTSERSLYRRVDHAIENLDRFQHEATHAQTVQLKRRLALAEKA